MYRKSIFEICLLCCVCILSGGYVETSTKKGAAFGPNTFLCGDMATLNNFTWWYDWRQDFWFYNKKMVPSCDITAYKPKYVPMIWGKDNVDKFYYKGNNQPVLLFNEPNVKSQSNLSPTEAATHFKTFYLNKNPKDKALVSPSASPCGGGTVNCHGSEMEWFTAFFDGCPECKNNTDYLATHMYYCNADTTMTKLQALYDAFGKKIWLTEFACPRTNSTSEQLTYMQAILPRLEAADYVEKYAWYMARVTEYKYITPSASLLKQNESTLTPLGVFYNGF